MDVEEDQEPNWGKMVSEVANELLKFKYMKKKAKKQLNPLEELTRVPSLNSKDSKKVITAQTKSIFTCLGEYYKEMISKSHFKKESLNNLKTFGEAAF